MAKRLNKKIKISNMFFESVLKTAQEQKWDVSILVDNPLPKKFGEGKESYFGKVDGIDKKFVFMVLTRNSKVSAIVIRKSMILSIWIYNPNYQWPTHK
jgi:hypothetical protein